MPDPPRLLDRVHQAIRTRHYSRRTEEAYVEEVRSLIDGMRGTARLVASILYGGGLRLLEALRLKHAGCHSLRHSFATHLLEDNYDIRTIQDLNPTQKHIEFRSW